METTSTRRRRPNLFALTASGILILTALVFYENPYRLYRKLLVLVHLEGPSDLTFLEDHLSNVQSVSIADTDGKFWTLSPSQTQKVLNIIRHIGPYDRAGNSMNSQDMLKFDFSGRSGQAVIFARGCGKSAEQKLRDATGNILGSADGHSADK